MTRPQYAPVPRGYVRVWVLSYLISNEWQNDGQWFSSSDDAHAFGQDDCGQFEWAYKVTPLDVPAGAIPGLKTTKDKRKKR